MDLEDEGTAGDIGGGVEGEEWTWAELWTWKLRGRQGRLAVDG